MNLNSCERWNIITLDEFLKYLCIGNVILLTNAQGTFIFSTIYNSRLRIKKYLDTQNCINFVVFMTKCIYLKSIILRLCYNIFNGEILQVPYEIS